MKTNEPFILQMRVALPPEPSPSKEHYYDYVRQIWVNSTTDIPAVAECNSQKASKFGETSMTETREGADQSEISAFNTSRFGETTMTKTSEGNDQGESILISQFGETTLTFTSEGHDTREGILGTSDAPYHHL